MQEKAGDDVREEHANQSCNEAEDGELDREDGGDAEAGSTERFENNDLAYAAEACSGDGAGEDDDAGEDGEGGEELDDVGDLDDDLAHGLKRLSDIDHGDSGVGVVERALELVDAAGHGMNAAVPDDGEAGERALGKDELGAREGVLSVGLGDGGDGGGELSVLAEKVIVEPR